MNSNPTISNRVARRDYFILESIEAGIQLTGTEIKSLRGRRASLAESFARVDGREIFLYHMHITPYEYSDKRKYDPLRPRKLLLHRREIDCLIAKISQKGLALIPLKIYFKNTQNGVKFIIKLPKE